MAFLMCLTFSFLNCFWSLLAPDFGPVTPGPSLGNDSLSSATAFSSLSSFAVVLNR